ncbi:MAG: ABC transporter permease [Verrucomicrobia bacterium]|nr:ABC transporter permease [Verrucomicrobiota bacterium]
MHPIFVLLRKDLVNFRRNRAAVILTFVVPFTMIWLFGVIFGVNKKDSGPSGIPLAVVNASSSPAAQKLIETLRTEKSFRLITTFTNPDKTQRLLTEADLRPLMEAPGADFRFALVIPADLISPEKLGLHFKLLSNPRNEIETQTVNGILQKTVFMQVPQLLGQSLQARAKAHLGESRFNEFNHTIASTVARTYGGDPAVIEQHIASGDFTFAADGSASSTAAKPGASSSTSSPFAQLINFETVQVVGANVKSPFATSIVGGWAIQFLLFALSASATGLFRERDAGLFQRLLAAPVTRAHILWSKFLYGVVLGGIQLATLFMAGHFLFGIDIFGHLGLLILVCLFAAGACTAFGMLLAACAPNAEAAQGLATLSIMLMSALGGAWFPITLMPVFIQQFSKFTLVYWSMEGFSAVLWAGQSFVQLLPILAILGGMTALVMAVAVWRFNRGRLFG